jgi:hypothetical protein
MHQTHDRNAPVCPDTKVLHAVHIRKSHLAFTVDKPKRPKMQHNLKTIQAPAHCRHHNDNAGRGPTDRRIRAFLSGETHGEDVLHALYGNVAGEPIPARLLAILKR